MILTAAQLARLRTHPQTTKLYLSVYQPSTVLTGQVTGTPSKGDRVLSFTLSSGSEALVRNGMVMYVGSVAGGMDKGTVRVRSASGGSLTVAENSHINWSTDDYITVVSFFEINAIFPRIIQNPADEEQTLWYKDYDIAYTDQNDKLGSFVCMGSHYAGMLENGVCRVYYSASGTYDLTGGSPTFSWFFEGATVTGSAVNTPGYIEYTTPGYYTTRLTVTNGEGGVDYSYRHISIHDRPGTSNAPFTQWELLSLSGSRNQGGHTASIRLHQAADPSLIREGSLVVIFAENCYGNLNQAYALSPRSNIFFVGYVLKDSVQFNYRTSVVEFEIGSPTEIMKVAEGFAVSVQYGSPALAGVDPDIPSGWVMVPEMDLRRALYHYLRWHSTVLLTNDFQFVGTDRPLQFFDTDRTSLYDAVQSAMKNILLGDLVCDRQGKLWAEVAAYIQPENVASTFTLEKQDWLDEVEIPETRSAQTAFIEMGGIAWDGVIATSLLSQAPGTSPGYRGKVERVPGLALLSQAELNQFSGRLFAQRNITYPQLMVKLAGNYANFDIAPQEFVSLTLTASDTWRGITLTNAKFLIDRVEWSYRAQSASLLNDLSLYEVGRGVIGDSILIDNVADGDTVPIPEEPESDGYEEPPPVIPPIIPPVIPPFADWTPAGAFLPVWTPILTANVGGSDVMPDVSHFGGVEIEAPSGYANVVIGFPAHNTGQVTIELLYYQIGSGGLVTIEVDASAYNVSNGTTADNNNYTETFTALSNKWKKSHPLALDWAGEPDVCLIYVNYDFTIAGFDRLYILGMILTWTE